MSDTPGRGYLPPTVPAPGPHRRQWPPPTFNFHYSNQWQAGKQFIIAPSSPQSESMDLSSRTELNGSDLNGTSVSVIASNPLLGEEKAKRLQSERVCDAKSSDIFISAPSHKVLHHMTEEKVTTFATDMKMSSFPGVKVPNFSSGLMASHISEMKIPQLSTEISVLKPPAELKFLNPTAEVKAPIHSADLKLLNPLPEAKYVPSEGKLMNSLCDIKSTYLPVGEKLSDSIEEKKVPYFPTGVKVPNLYTEIKISNLPTEVELSSNPPAEIKRSYSPVDREISNHPAEIKMSSLSTELKLPADVTVSHLPTEVITPDFSSEAKMSSFPSDKVNSPNIPTEPKLLNHPDVLTMSCLSANEKHPHSPLERKSPDHSCEVNTSNSTPEGPVTNHSSEDKILNISADVELPVANHSSEGTDLNTSSDVGLPPVSTITNDFSQEIDGKMLINTDHKESLPKIETQCASSVPAKAPELQPSKVSVDHLESLLENMFQTEEEENPSVIVPNNSHPVLTKDKVVQILETDALSPVKEEADGLSPVKEEPDTLAPAKDDIPDSLSPVKDESDSLSRVKEESDTFSPVEGGTGALRPAKEEKKEDQIMDVESELEKMFAGIVEDSPSMTTVDERIALLNKMPKRPLKARQRKSTDSIEPKNKKMKVEKSGPKKAKREKENSNDSIVLNRNMRGPYLQVSGPKDNPWDVNIVNSGGKEEEEKERVDKKKHLSPVEGRLKGPNIHFSTLSAKYNSQSVDVTWICTFCKKRAHCEGGIGGEPAGDLFGPYIITVPRPGDFDRGAPNEKDVSTEQRKKGGGKAASLRAIGAIDSFINNISKKSKKNQHIEELPGEKEVWVHEKCAVWAPGVYLVGSQLIGLAEAISVAAVTKCNVCGVLGASIGCVKRNCSSRVHYGCGILNRWLLDEQDFNSLCPTHSLKTQNAKSVT